MDIEPRKTKKPNRRPHRKRGVSKQENTLISNSRPPPAGRSIHAMSRQELEASGLCLLVGIPRKARKHRMMKKLEGWDLYILLTWMAPRVGFIEELRAFRHHIVLMGATTEERQRAYKILREDAGGFEFPSLEPFGVKGVDVRLFGRKELGGAEGSGGVEERQDGVGSDENQRADMDAEIDAPMASTLGQEGSKDGGGNSADK
jgi:hypothetical protein